MCSLPYALSSREKERGWPTWPTIVICSHYEWDSNFHCLMMLTKILISTYKLGYSQKFEFTIRNLDLLCAFTTSLSTSQNHLCLITSNSLIDLVCFSLIVMDIMLPFHICVQVMIALSKPILCYIFEQHLHNSFIDDEAM